MYLGKDLPRHVVSVGTPYPLRQSQLALHARLIS